VGLIAGQINVHDHVGGSEGVGDKIRNRQNRSVSSSASLRKLTHDARGCGLRKAFLTRRTAPSRVPAFHSAVV
jgi:hypothetical protein